MSRGLRSEGARSGRDWTEVEEAGSPGALRFALFAHRRLGRRALAALLRPAALYFCARSPGVRRASQRYLERVRAAGADAPAPSFGGALRHLHVFAQSIHDRMAALGDGLAEIRLEHDGSERLFDAAREGRGALLLGAHLGSFDMLRPIADHYGFTLSVLLYRQNARMINELLESLAPESRPRIIELDPATTRAAFEIRARIARGEFVAILADRVGPGQRSRVVEAPFLGAPARFSLGPFQLAALLGCPVFLTLGIRCGDLHYRTFLRVLSDGVRVPRRERDKHARDLLLRYLRELERACVAHPLQWFNFYDFWGEETGAAPGPPEGP